MKPRTKPTRADVRRLRKKLPHWRRTSDAYTLFKNLYCLFSYYLGPFSLARILHRRQQSRGAIILYHRVNDYSKDPLTVDAETFAAHLLALSRHYPRISTSELVDSLQRKKSIPPTSIAVHFDDCYRDVYTVGAPILATAGFRATAFISSGFVDTDRVFAHDAAKYPFTFPNLRAADVRAWAASGFETGKLCIQGIIPRSRVGS